MAGDWIKLEHATIDKPEVLEMADLLNINEDEVFGKLFRVWVWFDNQSRDGHAGNVTGVTLMKFIDRLVSSQGFAACMKKVGWLNDDGLPNFERHNGESAKNRALARDRKAKERSRESHDETVTREEKRRDITPLPPLSTSTSTPKPVSKAVAKTQAIIAEQRAVTASPMPDVLQKFVGRAS